MSKNPAIELSKILMIEEPDIELNAHQFQALANWFEKAPPLEYIKFDKAEGNFTFIARDPDYFRKMFTLEFRVPEELINPFKEQQEAPDGQEHSKEQGDEHRPGFHVRPMGSRNSKHGFS